MAPWIEPTCWAIILAWAAYKLLTADERARFFARYAVLVAGSCVAENSVIEAYGFYQYATGWTVYAGHVPLTVLLIWPMVVLSAYDLTRHLLGRGHRATALVAGGIVFADASLIEPISVFAGFWSWNEPGLFSVPPIGILGWALFASAAVHCFERRWDAWLIPVAVAFSHVALLATWWGALRWLNGPIPAAFALPVVWGLSILLAGRALFSGKRHDVPLPELLLRAPAAAFFFSLLAIFDAPRALVIYAMAFAPPFLALMSFPRRAPSPR